MKKNAHTRKIMCTDLYGSSPNSDVSATAERRFLCTEMIKGVILPSKTITNQMQIYSYD